MVYRELIFWVNRRDPLWAIQVRDSAFIQPEHKSNSSAMLNAVNDSAGRRLLDKTSENCGSPETGEKPEVVKLLLLVSFIFSCR